MAAATHHDASAASAFGFRVDGLCLVRNLFCCGGATGLDQQGKDRSELVVVIPECDLNEDGLKESARSTASGSEEDQGTTTFEAIGEEIGGDAVMVDDGDTAVTDVDASAGGDQQEQQPLDLQQDETEVRPAADERQEEPTPRPNFSGHWILEELEGNFEDWLLEMKQPWLIRFSAKHLRYGLGKVVVRCKQTGESFWFAKTLTDPRTFSDPVAEFSVGERVNFKDDIGKVTAQTSYWEGQTLVFVAEAADVKLPLQLRMYFDDRGRFVEEMVSWKGNSIKYYFRNSA